MNTLPPSSRLEDEINMFLPNAGIHLQFNTAFLAEDQHQHFYHHENLRYKM
jgi:hypothetical protein